MPPDTIRLAAADASVTIALKGAEPVSWRVGGRELLWNGDPAHWARSAPILFPVVGASAGGSVRVGGRSYPMPQHGFARDSRFEAIEQTETMARLRLIESDETWTHYPFRFALEVTATLGIDGSLALEFAVTNTDTADMPYALGLHPAFPWPFDGGAREDYAVEFEAEEHGKLPDVTADGLLRPGERTLPLDGRRLALSPDLFCEALAILDAHSRSMRFVAPTGAAIVMEVEDFPHLALWTRPTAPFLSLEAWTGHADWEGFQGELSERASIRLLPIGHTLRHAVTLRWQAA
jgi:galactose mutarotase-like enzyme